MRLYPDRRPRQNGRRRDFMTGFIGRSPDPEGGRIQAAVAAAAGGGGMQIFRF